MITTIVGIRKKLSPQEKKSECFIEKINSFHSPVAMDVFQCFVDEKVLHKRIAKLTKKEKKTRQRRGRKFSHSKSFAKQNLKIGGSSPKFRYPEFGGEKATCKYTSLGV